MKAGFIMISKLLSMASAAALAIILSTPTQANPVGPFIAIGASSGPALTFSAAGGNTLEVSSSAGFSGIASFDVGTSTTSFTPIASGVANFGTMDFFTGQPDATGVFTALAGPPGSPIETFSYQSSGNTEDLTAEITWNEVVSNAPIGEPQLIGTGMILTCSGDATFTSDFCVPGAFTIGGTMGQGINFPTGCDLLSLASGNCSGTTSEPAFLEGGNVIPGSVSPPPPPPPPPPLITVPEPMSSVAALGIALCCLWSAFALFRGERYKS